MNMRRVLLVLVLLLGALVASPAIAHPHIFIDATTAITFNDAGEVVSIHNTWKFDAAYSAWSIQGLDTNNDGKYSRAELQPLADDNMNGLAEYEYYTFAGEGHDPNLKFGHGSNPTLDYDGKQTTLSFDVALAKPYAIRKALELSIDDPEYYVAITFGGPGDVQLINAPKNCTIAMQKAKQMPSALADALYALPPDVTKLPPDLANAMRGMQGEILISCPGGSLKEKSATEAPMTSAVATPALANALDAVTVMADGKPGGDATDPNTLIPVGNVASGPAADIQASEATPPRQALTVPMFTGNIPFGAAPNEPGLNLPRTGVLGWIMQMQVEFYLALEHALSSLHESWTGFWLLGGLSFLYGIFHAAGPGHGKVVISSYMLANEEQVRRGVFLSFLSAMLQSAVAIAFVLVAASVLGMTAMAMSNAANWIGIVSYAGIALLGVWLLLRKLFGWGHNHRRDHVHEQRHVRKGDRMQALARRHMGASEHALATGGPLITSFRVAQAGPDAYGRPPGDAHYGHNHDDDDKHEHGHAHAVTPDQLGGGWREQLSVVLAVGLRPCSGALIVLAFAFSQGVLLAGIVAVLMMGIGTAITTGMLATLAVGFKGLARGLAGADNKVTQAILWWAEVLGACAVIVLGVLLVLASL
jgi:ABC-type nickel/cobalt efflux system permease component RcnA/ABC-type uncharacterized transport system substrate-binding protein